MERDMERVLEIAVCTVADPAEAHRARIRMMSAIRTFPGFVSWRQLSAHDKPGLIADLLEWENHAAAKAASERLRGNPDFACYMAAITSVALMQHFGPVATKV